MKFLHHLAGFVSAVCLMAILLITSVEAVAYWTPGYYEKEYTKYQVLEDLPEMTMEDLLTVTDEMMAYLRGDRKDLHVFTTMGGEYREFFNAREIAHMEDVRELFLGGLTIRRTAFCILIACVIFLIASKANLLAVVPKTMCLGMGAVFLAAGILGGIIATDFNKYFVIFHHIFFDNDLWILNPATDMLINIVPEPFFMDTAFRILAVFCGSTALIFLVCLFYGKNNAKPPLLVRKNSLYCKKTLHGD